jgi:hypothetical protein
MYGGLKVEIHAFLTSELDRGEWLASRLGRFTPRESVPRSNHWIGGWVGPWVGVDTVGKRKNPWLSWDSKLGHPAWSLVPVLK